MTINVRYIVIAIIFLKKIDVLGVDFSFFKTTKLS